MRGAEQLLRRDHPDLVLEIDPRFTPRFGYEPADLFDFLTGLSYNWSWFCGELRGTDIEQALVQTNNFLFTTRGAGQPYSRGSSRAWSGQPPRRWGEGGRAQTVESRIRAPQEPASG